MEFVLNRKGGLAVRHQLVAQLELRILGGELAPGEKLPSVRALARRLRLHPNTVSAAYRELEASRHVEMRRGAGVFVRREGEPFLTVHPEDAASRSIAHGAMVRVWNDRGSFQAKAHVSDAAKKGVVVGLSVWWPKMCAGGKNANAVTGQELTDMGDGATFYDALVEVAPL